MNNNNLTPIRSTSEAREKGQKGGIASGKARQEKRKMRQILTELLTNAEIGSEYSKESLALALIRRAGQGDVKAFELIMRFIGDIPTNDEQKRTDEEIRENRWDICIS